MHNLSCKMFCLSGLFLLLLDPSMICGQTTQNDTTAFEDESIRVKNESVQQELNKSLSTERPGVMYEDNGQTTQNDTTAFEDESIRVKNESVQQELNKSLSTERPGVMYDNENFQNETLKIRYSHCHEKLLKIYGEQCREFFNDSMSELGKENWCNLEKVIRNYHRLTDCMEIASSFSDCFYPNHVVEQLFVMIHQHYFSHCNNEEDLPDAPAEVVLVSTLLPILLIPFIVYIVVWKSSLRD